MEIIEKYSNKPWNWKSISNNPNITIEFIKKYPDKDWNWDIIIDLSFKKAKKNFLLNKYRQYIEKIEKRWRILFDLHSNYLPLELAHNIVLYAGF
jgi:hypothetical protein